MRTLNYFSALLLLCLCSACGTTSEPQVASKMPFLGIFKYEAEQYMYQGADPATGQSIFRSRAETTGMLTIKELAGDSLRITDIDADGNKVSFTASSYTLVDSTVYFKIRANQDYDDVWRLRGMNFYWPPMAERQADGFAGEFQLKSKAFRFQYAVVRAFESAVGNAVDQTMFIKKIKSVSPDQLIQKNSLSTL